MDKWNISINSCNHQSSKFNNNPKKYVSFTMKALYTKIDDKNKAIHDKMAHLIQLTKTGLCQQCAYQLAIKLPTFLASLKKNKKYYFVGATDAIYYLCFTLFHMIHYPSLAKFYFHHTKLWKYIMQCVADCCNWQTIERENQDFAAKETVSSFNRIHDYVVEIGKNIPLMQHSK